MPRPDDTLVLLTGGRAHTGWQRVRVTRGIERMPSDFSIEMTERFPGQSRSIAVRPGDPCQVAMGSDLVLTGYIDRYAAFISPRGHVVRITGRGKCEDLVDCSVTPDVLTGMAVITSSLVDLATRLARPFGISVSTAAGQVPTLLPGGTPLQFNAALTETPYEILERVARWAGVLVYEDAQGNLVIANVAAGAMASGLAQGVNVEQASVNFSMDQRYSEYWATLTAVSAFGGENPGNLALGKFFDNGVPRFRPLIVVTEQYNEWGSSLAQLRAKWEMARRAGRSNAVRARVDSWRDSAGVLWQPNYTAPINLPVLKLGNLTDPWVIAEVTYERGADDGTTAELVMMPRDAFQPQPEILVPFLWDPNSTASGTATYPTQSAAAGPSGTQF